MMGNPRIIIMRIIHEYRIRVSKINNPTVMRERSDVYIRRNVRTRRFGAVIYISWKEAWEKTLWSQINSLIMVPAKPVIPWRRTRRKYYVISAKTRATA